MSLVKCENCDNFASKQLSEAVGWNGCGPCVTGEASSLTEYMDYFEQGDDDAGEDWSIPPDDVREESKIRRANNRANSAKILLERAISFTSHNQEAHLVVTHGKTVVDFWPGTGKYIFRKTNTRGRGVFNLLKDLGVKSK